jgi:hypothetical protein
VLTLWGAVRGLARQVHAATGKPIATAATPTYSYSNSAGTIAAGAPNAAGSGHKAIPPPMSLQRDILDISQTLPLAQAVLASAPNAAAPNAASSATAATAAAAALASASAAAAAAAAGVSPDSQSYGASFGDPDAMSPLPAGYGLVTVGPLPLPQPASVAHMPSVSVSSPFALASPTVSAGAPAPLPPATPSHSSSRVPLPAYTAPSALPREPIVDVQIVPAAARRGSAVPPGYSVVERSASGRFAADLNPTGRGMLLAVKRRGPPPASAVAVAASAALQSSTAARTFSDSSSALVGAGNEGSRSDAAGSASPGAVEYAARPGEPETLRPLTALSVMFAETGEEPPLGFELLARTRPASGPTAGSAAEPLPANLNAGTPSSRIVFLAAHRASEPLDYAHFAASDVVAFCGPAAATALRATKAFHAALSAGRPPAAAAATAAAIGPVLSARAAAELEALLAFGYGYGPGAVAFTEASLLDFDPTAAAAAVAGSLSSPASAGPGFALQASTSAMEFFGTRPGVPQLSRTVGSSAAASLFYGSTTPPGAEAAADAAAAAAVAAAVADPDSVVPRSVMSGPAPPPRMHGGSRGCGAPVVDVALFLPQKERAPVDWHVVKWTPLGHRANLKSGVDSPEMRLAFEVDVHPVLHAVYGPMLAAAPLYDAVVASSDSAGGAAVAGSFGLAIAAFTRLCAILTAALYCADESLVLAALNTLKLLPLASCPPGALNALLHTVCDAVPCFLAYFSTHGHLELLVWLQTVSQLCFAQLTVHTVLRVLDVCFLIRHEDRGCEGSKNLVDTLITEGNKSSSLLMPPAYLWPATAAAAAAAAAAQASAEAALVGAGGSMPTTPAKTRPKSASTASAALLGSVGPTAAVASVPVVGPLVVSPAPGAAPGGSPDVAGELLDTVSTPPRVFASSTLTLDSAMDTDAEADADAAVRIERLHQEIIAAAREKSSRRSSAVGTSATAPAGALEAAAKQGLPNDASGLVPLPLPQPLTLSLSGAATGSGAPPGLAGMSSPAARSLLQSPAPALTLAHSGSGHSSAGSLGHGHGASAMTNPFSAIGATSGANCGTGAGTGRTLTADAGLAAVAALNVSRNVHDFCANIVRGLADSIIDAHESSLSVGELLGRDDAGAGCGPGDGDEAITDTVLLVSRLIAGRVPRNWLLHPPQGYTLNPQLIRPAVTAQAFPVVAVAAASAAVPVAAALVSQPLAHAASETSLDLSLSLDGNSGAASVTVPAATGPAPGVPDLSALARTPTAPSVAGFAAASTVDTPSGSAGKTAALLSLRQTLQNRRAKQAAAVTVAGGDDSLTGSASFSAALEPETAAPVLSLAAPTQAPAPLAPVKLWASPQHSTGFHAHAHTLTPAAAATVRSPAMPQTWTRVFHPSPDVGPDGTPFEYRYMRLENAAHRVETASERSARRQRERASLASPVEAAARRARTARAAAAQHELRTRAALAHGHNPYVEHKAERALLSVVVAVCRVAARDGLPGSSAAIPPPPLPSLVAVGNDAAAAAANAAASAPSSGSSHVPALAALAAGGSAAGLEPATSAAIAASMAVGGGAAGAAAAAAASAGASNGGESVWATTLGFGVAPPVFPLPLPWTALARSEAAKRRVHALNLLLHVLQRSEGFFKSNKACIGVLRRVVVPAVVQCCGCHWEAPAVFRAALQVFVHLFQVFHDELVLELGVVLEGVLVPLLASNVVAIDTKRDVLEMVAHLLSGPSALVSLYATYDVALRRHGLTVYESLVTALAALVQGQVRPVSLLLPDSQGSAASAAPARFTALTAWHGVAAAYAVEPAALAALRRTALRVLVLHLHGLAQWAGVPALELSAEARAALRATCQIFLPALERSPRFPWRPADADAATAAASAAAAAAEDEDACTVGGIARTAGLSSASARARAALTEIARRLKLTPTPEAGAPSAPASASASAQAADGEAKDAGAGAAEASWAAGPASGQLPGQVEGVLEDFLRLHARSRKRRAVRRLRVRATAAAISAAAMGTRGRRLDTTAEEEDALMREAVEEEDDEDEGGIGRASVSRLGLSPELPAVDGRHEDSSDEDEDEDDADDSDNPPETSSTNGRTGRDSGSTHGSPLPSTRRRGGSAAIDTARLDELVTDSIFATTSPTAASTSVAASAPPLTLSGTTVTSPASGATPAIPTTLPVTQGVLAAARAEGDRWHRACAAATAAVMGLPVTLPPAAEGAPVVVLKKGNLHTAVFVLRAFDRSFATPPMVALYLYSNAVLDKALIGDFLMMGEDKVWTLAQFAELRRAYGRMFDFTGMRFDHALRFMLSGSGNFRLPGEGQKVDRVVDMFCEAYCRDNPSMVASAAPASMPLAAQLAEGRGAVVAPRDAVFASVSTAHIVCFALIMLNTDHHDPRLVRQGASAQQQQQQRKRMTLPGFLLNLRDCNGGHPVDARFLSSLYASIAAEPIEWIGAGGTAAPVEDEHALVLNIVQQLAAVTRDDAAPAATPVAPHVAPFAAPARGSKIVAPSRAPAPAQAPIPAPAAAPVSFDWESAAVLSPLPSRGSGSASSAAAAALLSGLVASCGVAAPTLAAASPSASVAFAAHGLGAGITATAAVPASATVAGTASVAFALAPVALPGLSYAPVPASLPTGESELSAAAVAAAGACLGPAPVPPTVAQLVQFTRARVGLTRAAVRKSLARLRALASAVTTPQGAAAGAASSSAGAALAAAGTFVPPHLSHLPSGPSAGAPAGPAAGATGAWTWPAASSPALQLSTQVVADMWERVWVRVAAALSARVDSSVFTNTSVSGVNSSSNSDAGQDIEVDSLHLCVDALAYAATVSAVFSRADANAMPSPPGVFIAAGRAAVFARLLALLTHALDGAESQRLRHLLQQRIQSRSLSTRPPTPVAAASAATTPAAGAAAATGTIVPAAATGKSAANKLELLRRVLFSADMAELTTALVDYFHQRRHEQAQVLRRQAGKPPLSTRHQSGPQTPLAPQQLLIAAASPSSAPAWCKALFLVAGVAKKAVSTQRRLEVLRQLQHEFGGEVALVLNSVATAAAAVAALAAPGLTGGVAASSSSSVAAVGKPASFGDASSSLVSHSSGGPPSALPHAATTPSGRRSPAPTASAPVSATAPGAPGRSLIKAGQLVKIASSTGKPQEYAFFLLSDLLLYATSTGGTSEGDSRRLRLHRALHLSLLRLVDMPHVRSPGSAPHYLFKVVSPQKTFVVSAPDARTKAAWINAIAAAAKAQLIKRAAWVRAATSLITLPPASAPGTPLALAPPVAVASAVAASAPSGLPVLGREGSRLTIKIDEERSKEGDREEDDDDEDDAAVALGLTSPRHRNARLLPVTGAAAGTGTELALSRAPSSESSVNGPPPLHLHRGSVDMSSATAAAAAAAAAAAVATLEHASKHRRTLSTTATAPFGSQTVFGAGVRGSASGPGLLASGSVTVAPALSDMERVRRYSHYAAHSSLPVPLPLAVPADATPAQVAAQQQQQLLLQQGQGQVLVNHCRLCLRNFTLFRRKAICTVCRVHICNECMDKRANVPASDAPGNTKSSMQKVCDACWGHLTKMIGDHKQIYSTSE